MRMVRKHSRIHKNRATIHMQNKAQRIGMAVCRNAQEPKRSGIIFFMRIHRMLIQNMRTNTLANAIVKFTRRKSL